MPAAGIFDPPPVPRFAAPGPAGADRWDAWRNDFRRGLAGLLGLQPRPDGPVEAAGFATERLDGYTRTYIEYGGASGPVPAWLLVPEGRSEPGPAVIAPPGHGFGADEVVGLDSSGRPAGTPAGFHQHFAVELCRRGAVVLVPEPLGLGRRRDPRDVSATDPAANSCRSMSWRAVAMGRTLLGSRVDDVLTGLRYLQSLPSVDSTRIGVAGGSGGGATALFASAVEPSFRATAVFSYFCDWNESILAMRHCDCNYVPGLSAAAAIHDVAALIAPRTLILEAGRQDPIFPIHGVRAAWERLHSLYGGPAGRLSLHLHDGGHVIDGSAAFPLLLDQLRRPAGADDDPAVVPHPPAQGCGAGREIAQAEGGP